MMKALNLQPGVVLGNDVLRVLNYAKEHKFAIPAVNCTSSSTINACLEAAKAVNSPIIIQFSNGGAAFMAGKALSNENQKAAVAGSVAGARMVHSLAVHYGVPVLLHTDHCAKKLLPWLDGCLDASEAEVAAGRKPLFSSHMIDLSEEPHAENVALTAKYHERCAKLGILLEMEIGITGGEEDGVDNSHVQKDKLYSTPEDVELVYRTLNPISPAFTIAAAFGNVHGVYAPGNVILRPEILGDAQKHVKKVFNTADDKPVLFVFHGGSGSTKEEIHTAVANGVVKMNIDTDTQWSYFEGLRKFVDANAPYLQSQIGNPDGPTKPNKGKYDPRVWVRQAEVGMVERLKVAFADLNCNNRA